MNPEIKSYITRSVTDIARKCHCKEDDVWKQIRQMLLEERTTYKVVNQDKAKEMGITMLSDGILAIDVSRIPPGISGEELFGHALEKGYIELLPQKLTKDYGTI